MISYAAKDINVDLTFITSNKILIYKIIKIIESYLMEWTLCK